jgi:dipeptidyl aminopeptidase/acylaminoacyl peptidase
MIPQPAHPRYPELIRFTSPKVSSLFHSFLRTLCLFLCALCVNSFLFPPSSRAQNINLDKPLQSIDDDITGFAYAPDGRIIYSVRRLFKTKLYDLQRDDIWLQDLNGKRHRLLAGEKFTRGNAPFTYTIGSYRWSPNGRLILAQLFTTSVVDADSGKTEDAFMTLVLDDNGKEIRLGGLDSVIRDSSNASWLLDNSTVIYLTEVVKPHMLSSFKYINIATGPVGPAFDGRTFLDVEYIPRTNIAIAVERDRNLSGPPRLQRLDLLAQDAKELATLDGYEGGISVSPSAKKVAYYIDKEILEVRDLTAPDRVARVRIGLGLFQWSPDETRIFLKRAIEKKSGDLVWIDLPPFTTVPANAANQNIPVSQPVPAPILHGVTFRDFAISPDGRFLAVVAPGKRNLLVFPFSQR